MWTNLRLGVRRLMKDRGVSAAAICALALALPAVNTIFTLFNGIFLRPLPLERPDRVVCSTRASPDGLAGSLVGVTIVACLVPARRAVGVDSARALRAE